ncbi:MAG: ribose 5-phosphate isomerase B [Phycisphaerales bacterium]|nr:ribose 5-phosphate isomerase B [Phycisphaerales bacterium]
MKIAIGSDHAGFDLKEHLRAFVESLGHEVVDVGTNSTESVDYPDFAEKVAVEIITRRVDRGIMLCGSGVGASVAANKVPGIRAANCEDYYSAHQGVEHDDMNMLVLGGRIVGSALAEDMVRGYLAASYTGEDRHARRLAKVASIEARSAEFKAMQSSAE